MENERMAQTEEMKRITAFDGNYQIAVSVVKRRDSFVIEQVQVVIGETTLYINELKFIAKLVGITSDITMLLDNEDVKWR